MEIRDKNIEILEKIKNYCEDILEFATNSTHDEFINNKQINYSICFPIAQIGELSNKLTKEFRNEHDHIEWTGIIAVRNRIIHGYGSVKMDFVWEVMIKDDIPQLKVDIEKILKEYK